MNVLVSCYMMDCVCVTVAEESVENRESTGTTDVHVSVSPEIATAEHAPIGYVGRSWYSLQIGRAHV